METPIIDREIFFGNPEITSAQLSPDGQMISFVRPLNGVRNIWINQVDAPLEEALPMTQDHRPIIGYFWSRDSRFILYAQDKDGDENFCIYRVSVADAEPGMIPRATNLTPYEGIHAMIFRVSKKNDDLIFIGLNDRDASWHDLYACTISSGELQLIYKNENFIEHYLLDQNDQLRIVSRPNEDGGSDILSIQEGKDQPELIFSSDIEENIMPVRFHESGDQVYVITNAGERDKTELVLYDLSTKVEMPVHTDPLEEVDLQHASFSELQNKLIYTIYEKDIPRYYFFDSETEADFKLINDQLPESIISVTSTTRDETMWLINAYSDRDPGATYAYNRTTKELKFLFHPRPELPIEHLSEVRSIAYQSIDGVEIPAYLTIPNNLERTGAAVVLVHGGPWARDHFGYHSYAQFLANRGYVVLQPNFRSSTGFGKKFLNAGNLEWGRKMQDDITAATGYLVNHKHADVDKIGIMGGSYGGYATLAALAFTPEVFAAGVDIVGPSSLLTLLEAIPSYWEAARRMLYLRVGNPETEEGLALLKERSPLFSAHRIKAPLLVIQGANDPRVKQAEADQIVVALRERGFPVEYLVAPDEGHGFRDPINNMAMIAAIEKFLAAHLGGRFQEDRPDDIEDRLNAITVDVESVAV